MPDGTLKPLTRHKPGTALENGYRGASKTIGFIARQWAAPSVKENEDKPSIDMEGKGGPEPEKGTAGVTPLLSSLQPMGNALLGTDAPLDLDIFLSRLKTHMFSISCMVFQDVWNVDLERVKDCCIHVLSPEGGLIPFCMYNLTDVQGRSLYRKKELGSNVSG